MRLASLYAGSMSSVPDTSHTRSTMRTAIRAARAGIAAKDDDAQDRLRMAMSKLDKAAKKGVIKKQTASRRKSRLMRLYNREVVAG